MQRRLTYGGVLHAHRARTWTHWKPARVAAHLAPFAVAISPDGEVTDEQVVVAFIDKKEK